MKESRDETRFFSKRSCNPAGLFLKVSQCAVTPLDCKDIFRSDIDELPVKISAEARETCSNNVYFM
jgi:hypothetical protein